MSDQMPFDLQRRSSYLNTPVLSPTESIAFSDSLPLSQQPPYEDPLENYSPQDVYPTQHRWHPQPEYIAQRMSVGASAESYANSGPAYYHNHTSSSEATAVVLAPAYATTEAHPQVDARIQSWYSHPEANHQRRNVPVTHVPASFAQSLPAWQHQLSQQQLDCYNDSRQNPMTGDVSNTSNNVDSLSQVSDKQSHHQVPQQEHPQSHHYPGSSMLNYPPAPSSFPSSTAGSQPEFNASSSADLLDESNNRQRSVSNVSQLSQPAHGEALEGQVPPKRKRGRPKLNREVQSTTARARQGKQNRRQPHNEIERKYREGLNSEMEKLREAIPPIIPSTSTNTQLSSTSAPSKTQQQHLLQPQNLQKPTKAAVIKSAVLEIERLKEERLNLQAALTAVEQERDEARREAQMLKRQAS